jgi:hypothetical protein
MSNLVPINVNIPAHLAARIGAPSVLAQSVMAGLGGGPSFPKISIKGSRFRIKEGSTETVLNRLELEVVIVGANPRLSKTWYATKWDPNAEPVAPDCYSLDGVSPAADAENPQNDLCASCPKNAWGSEVTEKGQQLKACSDHKRLAVVAADDPSGPIYLLEVTPAALKGLNQYQRELTMRGIPAEVVKTKVTFDTDASFPKLQFAFGGFLEAETQSVVDGLFGSPEVAEVTGEATAGAPAPAPAPAPRPQVAPKPVAVVAPPPPAPAPAPAPVAEAAPRRGFGASKPAAPVAEPPVAAPAPAPRVVRARAAAPAVASAAPAAAPTAPAAVASLADEIAALVGEVGADDA